jgi:AraC family transcriptional regulator
MEVSLTESATSPPRRVLLRSPGLSVVDYRCTAAPGDPAVAEQHARHVLAYVRRGSFGCRCRGRSFDLVAGSIFIGHPGDEYTCTHEHHGGGDECLSFHFEPALADEIGASPMAWRIGALPPLPALGVLGELAQAAARGRTDIGVDEAGLRLARRFVELVDGREAPVPAASAADRRRATRAALWIEANSQEAIDLDAAAAQAGLSSFHFLRVFSRVFGLTPHQYLIRRRLGHAARLLADDTMPITELAFHVGFGDLSNFVRSFGQAAGLSPSQFRRLARGERHALRDRLAAPVAARC